MLPPEPQGMEGNGLGEVPGKALEGKDAATLHPLGGQTGRVVVFLVKALVGPLLSPQAPGVGACSCCACCSPPALGASSGAGHLDVRSGEASGKATRPCPCPAVLLWCHRSHPPSSPCVCPPGATEHCLQQPLCTQRSLEMGISLSPGQLAGWGGESGWRRGFRGGCTWANWHHSPWGGHCEVSISLSFQEPAFVGGDPPLVWPCQETPIPAQGPPLAPELPGEQLGEGPGPGGEKGPSRQRHGGLG